MTVTPQPLALGELFQGANGKEYALQWYNGPEKGRHGTIRMTDLLFNWCFYPAAFGADGAQDTRTVASTVVRGYERRIGGPKKDYARAGYTKRVRPTFRMGAYDSGKQFYVYEGEKQWNFEVTGDSAEFRLWLDRQAALGMLRRTLMIRSDHSVGSTHVPILNSI
jgi:hypothetical protein